MSARNLLHFKHLGNFVLWCKASGIETALPIGEWQVLKVKIKDNWDAIYIKQSAREHFSISDNLASVVRKFYKELTI